MISMCFELGNSVVPSNFFPMDRRGGLAGSQAEVSSSGDGAVFFRPNLQSPVVALELSVSAGMAIIDYKHPGWHKQRLT